MLYDQSEDNSHFDGCHLNILCAADATSVSFPVECHGAYILSVNSDHRQTADLIIAQPDGAESEQEDWYPRFTYTYFQL